MSGHCATRRGAPATALPDLISQLESVNEQLSSNEEGELTYVGRRDLREKRNRLAEQIAELESGVRRKRKPKGPPSQLEAARRARGDVQISYRTTADVRSKLRDIAEQDGCPANEILDMLVSGEWESRQEQLRIAENGKSPARRSDGRANL